MTSNRAFWIRRTPNKTSGLAATVNTQTSITLNWTATKGALGYAVFLNGTQIASTNGTSYVDTGLTANTLYSYNVAAFNAHGNGPLSSTVTATTLAGSGSLTITTASLPNATSGGSYFVALAASGGVVLQGAPSYTWGFAGSQTFTGNNSGTKYFITADGQLEAAPIGSGTDTLTIYCTDKANTSVNVTLTVVVNHTLAVMGQALDLARTPIAGAYASTKYKHVFTAAGGTAPYTFAISSGSLPTGLSLSAAGVVTGTCSSGTGTSNFTVQATDNAALTATGAFSIAVAAQSHVSRPGYNTGSGFFVDSGGILRDPGGNEFRIRGINRAHWDSYNWASAANGALSQANSCRTFFDYTRSVASNTTLATNEAIANGIVSIACFNVSAGSTNVADLNTAVNAWVAQAPGTGGWKSIQNNLILNVCNEWGPAYPSTGTQAVKWHPGHYLASNTVIKTLTGDISVVSGELSALSSATNVLGYRAFIAWGSLQQAAATYDWRVIDNLLTSLAAMGASGKRLVVVVLPGEFNSTTVSIADIPNYMLNDSQYGASPVAGQYGWWGGSGNGNTAVACLHRAKVMGEFIKLFQAMGTRYDSHPLFEGVMFQEDSWVVGASSTNGCPDYSNSGFITQNTLWLQACVTAFPTSNVAYQNTFLQGGGGPPTGETLTQQFEQTIITNRCLPAETDTIGHSGAPPTDWGMKAYKGVAVSGSTYSGQNYSTTIPSWLDVEQPDYNLTNSMSDTLTAVNSDYRGSHVFWTWVSGGAFDWATVVAPFLANGANAITSTYYPANYPQPNPWRDNYISAVQALRTAGYLCPIMIDSGNFGQDLPDLTIDAQAVLAADTQKNLIFSYHLYGSVANMAYQVTGASSSGGNTTLTINAVGASNPFRGGGPGGQYIASVQLSGFTGSWSGINGGTYNIFASGGSSAAYTITFSFDASSYGAYSANGGTVIGEPTASKVASSLAALRANGICAIIGEFGPSTPPLSGGPSTTGVTAQQVIQACEANGLGWLYWAWDDNNQGGGITLETWFGATLTGPGNYSVPTDLTYTGLDVVSNPNYGLQALALKAPTFL